MAVKILLAAATLVLACNAAVQHNTIIKPEVEAELKYALKQAGPLLKPVHKKPALSLLKTNLRSSKGDPTQVESLEEALTPEGGWSSEFEKDVMEMVMGLSQSGMAATPFGSSVQKIIYVIEEEMMPEVRKGHDNDQQEINELVTNLKKCGGDPETMGLAEKIAEANKIHVTYQQQAALHKECRSEEGSLYTENVECHKQWRAAKEDKILKCKAFLDVQVKYGEVTKNQDIMQMASGESEDVETYVRRVSATVCGDVTSLAVGLDGKCCSDECGCGSGGFLDTYLDHKCKCNKATTLFNDLTVKCKNLDASWHEKRASCDNVQDEMDKASCRWAGDYKNACEAYYTCYEADKGAYDVAVFGGDRPNEETGEMETIAGIKSDEKDRWAEWKGLKRMRCIIEAFTDLKVDQCEIETCRLATHEVDGSTYQVVSKCPLGKTVDHAAEDLRIRYPGCKLPGCEPELPDRDICTIPSEYPNTADYKIAQFDPLPTNARGKLDSFECTGLPTISSTPAEGSPEGCTCERVTMNGPFSPGPLVVCRECLDVRKSLEKNSCPEGTKIFSPRNRQDWDTFIKSTDATDLVKSPNWIVDVTLPEDGCDGCVTDGSPYPNMNHEAYVEAGYAYRKMWHTSDGSTWWLRSTPYEQPSGDSFANCYMDLGAHLGEDAKNFADADSVTFDDQNCNYHSKSYYCQQTGWTATPKEGSPEGCVCKRVELTGEYSAHVLMRCEKCNDVYKSTDVNSCPAGTKIFSPRTREDWKTFLNSAGPLRSPYWIIDVTRPQNGCGGCTEAAMKSDVPAQATWHTSDMSPWWLRETAYDQPNGDYEANCYLDLFSNPENENSITFDDVSCNAHSRSYYCQSIKTTTTTTTTVAPIPPPAVDDASLQYESEGRTVYLFKTSKCVDVRTQTSFCPDKSLLWFTPKSQADADKLVADAYAVDTWHTWIQLYQVPHEYSVGGANMGSASQDWSAIRQWSSRSCTTDTNNFESCCWDKSHDYDWFVCESMPEPETTTTTPEACPNDGVEENERCWYLGAEKESCDTRCETEGLSFDWLAAEGPIAALLAKSDDKDCGKCTEESPSGGVLSVCLYSDAPGGYWHPAGVDSEKLHSNGNDGWTTAERGAWPGFGNCLQICPCSIEA